MGKSNWRYKYEMASLLARGMLVKISMKYFMVIRLEFLKNLKILIAIEDVEEQELSYMARRGEGSSVQPCWKITCSYLQDALAFNPEISLLGACA